MSATNAAAPARRALPTRLVWATAVLACALATAEAVALAFLAPMKTAQTEATLVDRKTGAATVAMPSVSEALTPAVSRALLMQYLRAREAFDDTDVRQSYAKVVAWSSPGVAAEYRQAMARANPESPLSLYPSRTTVSPILKAISLLSNDTALIRFELSRQDGASRPSQPTAYTSVISFDFRPNAAKDVVLNPLGFQVTKYSRSADANGLGRLVGK